VNGFPDCARHELGALGSGEERSSIGEHSGHAIDAEPVERFFLLAHLGGTPVSAKKGFDGRP
jgi:hypothetical protein